MILLVCGGRDFRNRAQLFAVLDQIHRLRIVTKVVQGGASGADSLAARWAMQNQIEVETIPARWEMYGPKAGHLRNHAMAGRLCYYRATGEKVGGVAFPGGKGTANMVQILKSKSITVMEVNP